MKTYYHVTLKENYDKIMVEGLIPQIGERANDYGEDIERIYLFPSEDDMNTALSSWLGECFDEDVELCSLLITLPDNFPITDGEVEYEAYSYEKIEPKYITYLRDE